jgi:hypothetical protein
MQNRASAAVNSLTDILSITPEQAEKLVSNGINSIEVVQTVGADDIAGILETDLETGTRILNAALAVDKTAIA